MFRRKIIWFAAMWVFIGSLALSNAQGAATSGVYQITSGTYVACCGIGGSLVSSLPNASQTFIRLSVDPLNGLASMTFLGKDMRTVFSVPACPPGEPVGFSFDHGFIFSNTIAFHVDPGPPPNSAYWNYTVTNSADSLRLDGLLGMATSPCADVPNRFSHSNVVAVLVTGSRLTITAFSTNGALLMVQGQAGWTNVIQASMDLINWTPLTTNVMPNTFCPICPYFLYRDLATTNLARRFYRGLEAP